ncbi:MAG: DNA repair protein RadA [Lachnospiraceae bacterium]|jgi:DNA repair protein RadA/Sms|nr:DNA repair protein RadA [Lachnospiraceae bacterium]MCI1397744.1 DNA repair protein RadA [Lachnospiraceae bacterium]MCI1423358.1 DNA repair protein RadA [Lachnospiraceae bacterium]MCI1452225.1 DNA repair protein RadA [Lachnospiraceae bacterium]MDD5850005.1 DNA repair protein RadA [Bacillota bacterium]
MPNKKRTTAFYCSECGYESSRWVGQCPACHAWNTMVEAPVRESGGTAKAIARGGTARAGIGLSDRRTKPVSLNEVEDAPSLRWSSGYGELDRVLGGGIVRGAMVLVGGDPGIGKSTLLLQVTKNLAAAGHTVLYVSGEESLQQIKLRARRIGAVPDNLKFMCETDLDTISEILLEEKPEICVIDSIQTMYNSSVDSAPGSVTQVRETTGVLMRLAKEQGITFFVIGHVTKEGTVAGPRVLEHMVDTVLYFEGDRYASYRIIRGVKNRFGSTNEIGVFEMRSEGLREVENPSEFMLSGRPEDASGSVVSCTVDGTRAMLIEVQGLVCPTNFGYPKRQATGTDYNRVSLLLAVLEKRLNIPLSSYDAYVNLAGGIRQTEPALDLGICLAILSSFRNRPIGDRTVAFGEVGLSGEVRMVSMADIRVAEAAKLGFTTCILPASNLRGLKRPEGMELVGVRSMQEAADLIQR